MNKCLEKIKIGSRSSSLAKKQVKIFMQKLISLFSKEEIEETYFKTTGDKILDKKLGEFGNKGLFTKEIDEAQLSGKIDLAIHSLKDLPYELPTGLVIAAYLKREDYRDAIVLPKKLSMEKLDETSIIGTSSLRREIQIKRLRRNVQVKLIRGNIETRINKVLNGSYDGVILAMAGLNRLNIRENIIPINSNQMIPAVGQGSIAIVARKKDNSLIKMIRKINDTKTEIESKCERSFLKGYQGSCNIPLGALALHKSKYIDFIYMVSDIDGSNFRKERIKINFKTYLDEAYKLGKSIKVDG